MSVYFFSSLTIGEHSNLLIVAAFFNSPVSVETSPTVKNLFLPTFPNDKAEIVADCIKFCFADFYYQLFGFSY